MKAASRNQRLARRATAGRVNVGEKAELWELLT